MHNVSICIVSCTPASPLRMHIASHSRHGDNLRSLVFPLKVSESVWRNYTTFVACYKAALLQTTKPFLKLTSRNTTTLPNWVIRVLSPLSTDSLCGIENCMHRHRRRFRKMADSSQLAMQSELESAVKDAWKCLQFKKCQKKCWVMLCICTMGVLLSNVRTRHIKPTQKEI